jgi:hypothetical protein
MDTSTPCLKTESEISYLGSFEIHMILPRKSRMHRLALGGSGDWSSFSFEVVASATLTGCKCLPCGVSINSEASIVQRQPRMSRYTPSSEMELQIQIGVPPVPVLPTPLAFSRKNSTLIHSNTGLERPSIFLRKLPSQASISSTERVFSEQHTSSFSL